LEIFVPKSGLKGFKGGQGRLAETLQGEYGVAAQLNPVATQASRKSPNTFFPEVPKSLVNIHACELTANHSGQKGLNDRISIFSKFNSCFLRPRHAIPAMVLEQKNELSHPVLTGIRRSHGSNYATKQPIVVW
jgi:hypothetical protein